MLRGALDLCAAPPWLQPIQLFQKYSLLFCFRSEIWRKRLGTMSINRVVLRSCDTMLEEVPKFTVNHPMRGMGCFIGVKVGRRKVDVYYSETLLCQDLCKKLQNDRKYEQWMLYVDVEEFQTSSLHISREWISLIGICITPGYCIYLPFSCNIQNPMLLGRRRKALGAATCKQCHCPHGSYTNLYHWEILCLEPKRQHGG